jgi:hypothetical protein
MNCESKELIEHLVKSKRWDLLDTIIKSVNVPLTKSDILLTYAPLCFPYRHLLPSYKFFIRYTHIVLTERGIYPCKSPN